MAVAARTEPQASAVAATRVWSWDRPVQWLVAVLAAGLIVFLLVPILLQSVLDRPLYEADRVLTFGNFTRILASAEFWTTVATTVGFAGTRLREISRLTDSG